MIIGVIDPAIEGVLFAIGLIIPFAWGFYFVEKFIKWIKEIKKKIKEVNRLEDILKSAFKIVDMLKFFVEIGEQEILEMTFRELGTYLTLNVNMIESVHVKLKPTN